jgi:hypothetical protein
LEQIRLDPVDGFSSLQYFELFEDWLDQHVAAGNLVEEAAAARLIAAPRTRLFRVRGGDEVWQLVAPEDPFPGVFDRHERLNRPSGARRYVWPLLFLGLAGLIAFLAVWGVLQILPQ